MDNVKALEAIDFDRDSKGRILGTLTNIVEAVRWGIGGLWFYKEARFGVVYVDDAEGGDIAAILNDTDYTRVMLALEDIGFWNPPKHKVKEAVNLVAVENIGKPNPWIRKRP